MTKLTKRIVDALVPGKVESVHWDGELKGFGVRIWPTGRKVYIVKCRIKGRQRRITLGSHGTITADMARIRAFNILSESKAGNDPAYEFDAARKAPTTKAMGERFLDDYVQVHCKESTRGDYKHIVEGFINPAIGNQKIVDVSRKDIAELHHGLRRTPYQANRVLSVLSKMFNLAELWGLRSDGSNPCRHVKKFAEKKRDRFLSPAEFTRLGQVLTKVEDEDSETQSAIDAIRLLLLTGCRLNEILTLKWDHVDIAAREFRLPDSKTGAKIVHFGKTVVDMLQNIEKIKDNPFVITGRLAGGHLNDLQHPWRRIRAQANLDDVRLHDLRHSFASGAIALGEGLPMIGRLLGHSQVQTTARYAHLANDPVKAAAAKVSDAIGATIFATVRENML